MRPLTANAIRGNWATLLLAWDDDDTLDLARVANEIDTLVDMKVDGIYSNGTAGEFHALLEPEFDAVSALLAEKCNAAGMPFQVGVSHMSAQVSLDRLYRTVALEPGAVQVILPDWLPVTDEEAIAFLQKIADVAGEIGLVLYNPPHAKRVLTPREMGMLAKAAPTLVGVKVSDGDASWYADMRRYAGNLSLFVPGHHLASGFRLGAHGAYSNVACLHPLAAQRWTDQMADDLEGALELEARLQSFMSEHIEPFITQQGYANPALDRLLALVGGWADVGERMRWPYRWIRREEAERLRPVAMDILPEFFGL
jgi:dihydrodipicolinate synthase/N-acetylneuraminate lyase